MALSLGRRLLYATLMFVGVLGGTEGVLQLVMPPARRATLPNEMIQAHLEGAAFRFDPDLGWYWPGLGTPGSPVNAYGFIRAKPMAREKPDGVTRVITFGDSQTFGAGMTPDATYSARAEEALGEGWEVLNAGISGYRTMNIYRLLRLKMLAFEPDAIIIDCMPYDSPRDDGSLQGYPWVASTSDRLRALLWHSRLYYLMRLGLEKADPNRARWLDEAPVDGQAPGQNGGTQGQGPNGANGPRQGLGNHDLIAQWGKDNGIEVFFMEYAIMDEQYRFGCMTGEGELPPGPRVIPTCKRLPTMGKPARELYQDRNHLTDAGNRLVGQIVADSLREWKDGAK